jgi:hypothetical protein
MNLETEISRRRLLQGLGVATVAAAPVVLAACGDDDSSSSADIDEANDLKIVEAGQAREFVMVAVYTRLLEVAPPAAKPLVQEILTQEQAHATGLSTVITDLGGTPVKPVSSTNPAVEASGLRDWPQGRTRVIGIEEGTSRDYVGEIPKLTIGDLRATWTSLATAASQHITVLESLPR